MALLICGLGHACSSFSYRIRHLLDISHYNDGFMIYGLSQIRKDEQVTDYSITIG